MASMIGLSNKNKIAMVWLNSVCGFPSSKLRILLKVGEPAYVLENYEALKDRLIHDLSEEWYKKIVPLDGKRVYNMVKYFADNFIYVIMYGDEEYPANFNKLSDYPALIYCKGDISLLNARGVAVVGSREPSKYGLHVVNEFVREFVEKDLVIVSGLARGIDTAAHLDTLACGGKTIAVLGTGIDVIYPAENSELFGKIEQKGLIITEYPVRSAACQFRFPERNRLISALAETVFVAEAPEKSGSLITARCACEQGKIVYTVPVEITNPRGVGNNYLIKCGMARLVTSPHDILVEMLLERETQHELMIDVRGPVPEKELSEVEKVILERLTFAETHFDELLEITALGTSELTAILTKMELLGLIVQIENNYFGV